MKLLQAAVVAQAALAFASSHAARRVEDDMLRDNGLTTTTLYSTSYFTVTKCASDIKDCPTDATTVYTSVVPVTSTTTICLVTSAPISGVPSIPGHPSSGLGGPSTPFLSEPPYPNVTASSSGTGHSSQTIPLGSGTSAPSQTFPSGPSFTTAPGTPVQTSVTRSASLTSSISGTPGYNASSDQGSTITSAPLTSFTVPVSNVSSPYLPTSPHGTTATQSEGNITSSQPFTGSRPTPVQSGSATSLFYTHTSGNVTTTGFSSSNGYTLPPLITSATHAPSGTSSDPSDTNTDGILTSSRPYSSGYDPSANGSFTSTQLNPNGTWYPSLSSKPGPSVSSPLTTSKPSTTSVSGFMPVPVPSSQQTTPEDTLTTHVTSVLTHSGTSILTLPPSYNESATPTSTDVLETLTSSGTSVSGGPSGSASGYPWSTGGNSSVIAPKPTWSPINNSEGQSLVGTGKSSIAAMIVALAFANFV